MLTASLFGWENQGYDEAVETQDFSEDQNEDHADEEARLLGGSTDARVSHDADGKTGRQPAQTHAEACAQMQETPDTHKQQSHVSQKTKKGWIYQRKCKKKKKKII